MKRILIFLIAVVALSTSCKKYLDDAYKNPNLPLLGICYGHQLIVDKFGGKVKRANKELVLI